MNLGVFHRNRIGDLLEDGGLAGFWRRDDQTALAAPHGGDQVDQAGRQRVAVGFQVKAVIGENRGQVFKAFTQFGALRLHPVDRFHLQQPVVPLGLARRTHMPDDHIAVAQAVTPDLRLRDVHIAGAGLVVVGAQIADALAHHLQDAAADFQALAFGFGLADAHHQLFFLHAGGAPDAQIHRHLAQDVQGLFF